jgi:predicted hydrocarbon binding protein
MNILRGNLEALTNKKCIGEEIIKDGRKYYVFTLFDKNNSVVQSQVMHNKYEYDRLLGEVIDYIIKNKPSGRLRLQDKVHISGEQCETYFTVKASEGHRILERFSGIICGRKFVEKSGVKGVNEALKLLQRIFKEQKVCMLVVKENNLDRMRLTITESAYSSGVENIHMKLDLFIAGISEGAIQQARGKKYAVKESQCVANGDGHCEIIAKK